MRDFHGHWEALKYRCFPPRKRLRTLTEYLEDMGDIEGREQPKKKRINIDIYSD